MGQVRIDLSNFLAVGIMAFVGVWVINRVLVKVGKPQFVA